MDALTAESNLLTPAVLFFGLGLLDAVAKSDLKFPEPVYAALTIYLLVAIGFKGGVAIAEAGWRQVWLPALAAAALGAVIPLWAFPILRYLGRLKGVDAAAIAAHSGSVSAVTFLGATNFLKSIDQPYELYATASLAVMESPASTVAGRRLGDLRRVGPFLLVFGLVMPLIHGAAGVLLGHVVGLSLGGAALLGTLAASASYIAAPAAIRTSLPDANPTLYLTASLAVTFPFNVAVGIPIYFEIARWVFSQP
jgi:hypothetical protein